MKSKFKINGREVDIIDRVFEVNECAYVTAACFIDGGTDLTEEQLEEFNYIYSEALYDKFYQDYVDACENLFDSMNDR